MSQKNIPEERETLIRELELHQVELESQNQNLRDAHQALENSAARYTDLYDSAPISYCTLSRSCTVLEANLTCAALLESARETLIGTSLLPQVVPEHRARVISHLAQCEAREADTRCEISIRSRRGRTMLVEVISSPAGPTREGCRTVLTDITERKKLEEALRVSMRMREDFLAIVSHDLRNPLNNVLISTDMLLRQTPGHDRRLVGRKQLEIIKTSARRMNRLLADLLDLSSMDAGHLSIDSKAHSVSEFIASAVELAAPMAAEKEVRLMQALVDSTLSALCDRERTIQVLINLLTNAVNFTPPNGTVTVEARRDEDRVVIAVRDTGVGISPEQIPLLFKPYWQANKRVRVGTGLGLSIAKGIVEAHGGHIWAESARGSGTSFFFTLLGSTAATASTPPFQ